MFCIVNSPICINEVIVCRLSRLINTDIIIFLCVIIEKKYFKPFAGLRVFAK